MTETPETVNGLENVLEVGDTVEQLKKKICGCLSLCCVSKEAIRLDSILLVQACKSEFIQSLEWLPT